MNAAAIETIFELFERLGARHYGEGVSQIEHALQCAQLAEADGAGDSLIAAALLHDLGHLLEADEGAESETDARHEVRGAAALRSVFGPDVVQPIALHVAAKRYLCAAEPGYAARLSEASTRTLKLQGGPFSVRQARRFEAIPHFAAAVRLRRYDEGGKLDGAACRPLRDYAGLLNELHAGRTRRR
ncbi:phosphonate degradation HD-domain oxygenase [Phenylobacterium sp.]|uniref:phosphonate degradation HD-domain oxygenase n=1 Tax=Phenylobacterium sp. TaxID=1871053 RepID=UPI002B68E3A0|nr:phosphonate degradation HD-domain oxygenase [Phenylobacterium sp.]HLZ73432.1 HD domain-containing protein [Phenylobacterium sp.]